MSQCVFCEKEIEPGTAAVSVVGGLFPKEDRDFFMVDETVLSESYAHLPCLLAVIRKAEQGGRGNVV